MRLSSNGRKRREMHTNRKDEKTLLSFAHQNVAHVESPLSREEKGKIIMLLPQPS